ncbi:hypothetical protein OIDMADRAFT_149994 [Oidiodendron maius Zn]|uniref:Uncharacterized protein n=1 Tax=Oidiodendron maius (strain Zn) TaxID=913774 RepID=A0A0C3GME4_OIDMZ|nr:hypothetical protein OIDMADRAFT_149994 [Oidiodendron maius Zn]
MFNSSERSPIEDLGAFLAEYNVNDHVELLPFHEDGEQRSHADDVDLGSVVVANQKSPCSTPGIVASLSLPPIPISRPHYNSQSDIKLAVPCFESRQQKLHRAITSGLLGIFISSAKDLEELNIDLQCHEISSLQVEESDLVNFLRNYCWSQLRCLKIRGIWTSEDQLLDLLGRHQGSLKYLDIGDVVLKEGTWLSFFKRLKTLIAGSLVAAERFQLGGEYLASQTENRFEGRRWELNSLALPNKSLRDSLVEFMFTD